MGWQLSASRQTWLRPEGEERLYDDKTSDLSGAVEPALAWLGDSVRHFTGHCLLSLELSLCPSTAVEQPAMSRLIERRNKKSQHTTDIYQPLFRQSHSSCAEFSFLAVAEFVYLTLMIL